MIRTKVPYTRANLLSQILILFVCVTAFHEKLVALVGFSTREIIVYRKANNICDRKLYRIIQRIWPLASVDMQHCYLGLSGIFDGLTPKVFAVIAEPIPICGEKGVRKDLLGLPTSSNND